ncbi:TIGR03086 family metal-binding protein [Nocardia sp. CDC159]|uniref:TIGR03086 family metal-binding protein n=1 Tax=Nocardia pulmonis TaxID=2951408 RepID=A0A9X2E973_9NOCA|nr:MULTISPECIES: TIGR03086 family metal-binding protein [Nocardia]MCM6775940.1 TIGR03086 family metal-binding protein [Nocardia pulmonis]MCM6788084.1 TIGR03086 family metal-binding protein [Nocardia sp. CDC159]
MSTIPQTAADPAAALASVWRGVLVDAHRALVDVVSGIGVDQWQLPTPCSEWTVTQVIQHAAADQRLYAHALGVGGGPDYDPFAPSGTIDGQAATLIATAVDEAAAAWGSVGEDTATVPTPLPHGELPTPVAAVMCGLDAAVHAWDIAVATGQRSPLTEELATVFLIAATGLVDPLRQFGVFAAALDTEADATAVERLLRYLGRNPRP